MPRIIIAGGGLAGCLCALALVRKQPALDVLLVEEADAFGGNHTWSFFDTDIAADARWVLDGIGRHHWPAHAVRFPLRQRTINIGYNSIQSEALDKAVREALRADQIRLGERIASVTPRGVVMQSGERLEGTVLDARGPGPMPGLELGWQKFVGRTVRFTAGHGIRNPVIMDATLQQVDGYRFIYLLPLSERELLIEDTYYSLSPVLDEEAVASRIDAFARAIGTSTFVTQESGVLPVVLDGDIEAFWRGEQVARLGLRGGFFHPTTSYSLPDAVANAALLAEQHDVSSETLYSLFKGRAGQLWQERSFFRLLNRLLFRAAPPEEAYRILEHFYRLPPDVIARFYAAKTTLLDKARILSGRPPVPMGKALRVLCGKVA